ncbi:MAG TPA: hypothetical protein VJV79_19685 [Polyangiaceae bacterium]|nr:hypothetical protein [Polyangiaceae bacterium]
MAAIEMVVDERASHNAGAALLLELTDTARQLTDAFCTEAVEDNQV